MTRLARVWWADLDVPDVAPLWVRLTAGERQRAERFLFEHVRRRWVAAHAMVRSVLGTSEDFVVGAHGKPSLAGAGTGADRPHFNLSHSGERAVLAVCADAEVGVDVEQVREVGPGVAERIMSPDELAAWQAAGAEDRDRFLLEAWTRKEALVKATGEGVTRDLRTLSFAGHAVVALDADPGYVAALAMAGSGPVEVATSRWSPSSER